MSSEARQRCTKRYGCSPSEQRPKRGRQRKKPKPPSGCPAFARSKPRRPQRCIGSTTKSVSLEREEQRIRARLAELDERKAEIFRDHERETTVIAEARAVLGELRDEAERITAVASLAETETQAAHTLVTERRTVCGEIDGRLAALTREIATLTSSRQRLSGLVAEESRRTSECSTRHAKTVAEAEALAADQTERRDRRVAPAGRGGDDPRRRAGTGRRGRGGWRHPRGAGRGRSARRAVAQSGRGGPAKC